MNWEAANAPKARSSEKRAQEGGHHEDSEQLSPAKRRSAETVEAALSRLSKAYTTSMECIGALNKTNRMLQKKETVVTDEALIVLERVSNAARSTLETAILLDPLIVQTHVPTLNETMHNFSENDSERWGFVQEKRPVPPVLSSAAHKSTIRDLAYLALVNYSDLLQSCCLCVSSNNSNYQDTILDRGVVRKIKTLQDKNRCCWKGESHEHTQRLAVTALCDASNLDGSDPTLWLKLACASRGLERIVYETNPSTILWSKHRRLQRHALELGSQALPPNMPPNRAVMRALQELQSEATPETYQQVLVSEAEPVKLVLELPRYSWSMLGRMLVRACREGADFHAEPKHHQNSTANSRSSKKSIQFGSPAIEMHLSPMLVLPSRVLGRICLFLENSSIWRFEATCRALSVAIMSARASMEEEKATERPPLSRNDVATISGQEAGLPEKSDASKVKEEAPEDSLDKDDKGTKPKKEQEDDSKLPSIHHRSSQRLRSQQITSGKKAERSAKRTSFEYCFLAATLSCTREDHLESIKKLEGDESIHQLLHGQDASRSPSNRKGLSRIESSSPLDSIRQDARERLGDSSLSAFVERWSCRNSGPMDLMMNYLVHVAINVEDVFANDPGGTVVLTSCILSCEYEMQSRRQRSLEALLTLFSLLNRFRALYATEWMPSGTDSSFLQTSEIYPKHCVQPRTVRC
jgi:hypothetical protein